MSVTAVMRPLTRHARGCSCKFDAARSTGHGARPYTRGARRRPRHLDHARGPDARPAARRRVESSTSRCVDLAAPATTASGSASAGSAPTAACSARRCDQRGVLPARAAAGPASCQVDGGRAAVPAARRRTLHRADRATAAPPPPARSRSSSSDGGRGQDATRRRPAGPHASIKRAASSVRSCTAPPADDHRRLRRTRSTISTAPTTRSTWSARARRLARGSGDRLSVKRRIARLG